MLVKFTQNNLPYAAGEVANFDDEKAQQLIGAKVAEKFVEEEAAVEELPKPKANAKRETKASSERSMMVPTTCVLSPAPAAVSEALSPARIALMKAPMLWEVGKAKFATASMSILIVFRTKSRKTEIIGFSS